MYLSYVRARIFLLTLGDGDVDEGSETKRKLALTSLWQVLIRLARFSRGGGGSETRD